MSAPPQSRSSLATVIGSPDTDAWHTAKFAKWSANAALDGHPLAKFHKRFWGTSMAGEEKEWRDAQPPPVSAAGGEFEKEDGDEDEDGVEDEYREDEDDLMHQDEDEIIRGCYALDIGIKDLRREKVWIRRDYIRMYDYIDAHFGEALEDRPPAVVITGHSGIGRTTWVFYATRRRLSEGKPFIWYWHGSCFLFVEEGVYEAPQDFISTDPEILVWTFVDSDEATDGVPARLVRHDTHLSIIYTAPPRKEQWSRLHKASRDFRVLIMNPWTSGEIFQLAHTRQPPEKIDNTRIEDVFDQFGPPPMLCIELSADPEAFRNYQSTLSHAIANITLGEFAQLERDTASLSMDDSEVAGMLFSLSREKWNDVQSDLVVDSITSCIQSMLADRFRDLPRAEAIALYKQCTTGNPFG